MSGRARGFEKSGHFFLQPPVGRGYDDGIVAARCILEMLDRNPGKTVADLKPRSAGQLWLADHVAGLLG
jgi:phosphomannomutase/phosphoglucomutase